MTATAASAPGSEPAAVVAALVAEVEALRAALEDGVDLATRLDTVEHDLAATSARLENLAAIGALGASQAADGDSAYTYRALGVWVDEVFARLAARHHASWCPRWEQHLEARARLELLWHTWEASHTTIPGEPTNHGAHDEWVRVIFDHHTPWLLDREGPFAGCTPERCSPAPRLPQHPIEGHLGLVGARNGDHRGNARNAADGGD